MNQPFIWEMLGWATLDFQATMESGSAWIKRPCLLMRSNKAGQPQKDLRGCLDDEFLGGLMLVEVFFESF